MNGATFASTAADAVALVHALFSLFVMSGPFLLAAGLLLGWRWVRRPGFRAAHLGAVLFVAARAWLGFPCPLTWLEDHLRQDAAEDRPTIIQQAHTLAFRGEDPDRFRRAVTAWAVFSVAFVLVDSRRADARRGIPAPESYEDGGGHSPRTSVPGPLSR